MRCLSNSWRQGVERPAEVSWGPVLGLQREHKVSSSCMKTLTRPHVGADLVTLLWSSPRHRPLSCSSVL